MQSAEGQMTLFDRGSWCGKTSRERSAATAGKTLPPSLKKQSGSSSQTRPLCLCLRVAGHGADAYTMKWEDGPLLGEFTTRSFGASPSVENVSLLSQILEECPHPKYNLSARACVGVLRRAKRRGKELPEILDAALKLQICRELSRRAAERGAEPAPFLVRYAAGIMRDKLDDQSVFVYPRKANTLAARYDGSPQPDKGNGGNIVVTCGAFSKGQGEKARGIGWQEEVSPSLKAEVNGNNPPAVLIAAVDKIQCGNPWDTQTERIFYGDGVWHSLSANSGGGQSRDAILVFDARGNGDGVTVPTITGDHENRITDYTALCIGNGQTNNISMAEQENTLDTMHDQQAILCFQNTGAGWLNQSGTAATVRTPCGGGAGEANLVAAFSKGTRPHCDDEPQKWHLSECANTLTTFDLGESRANELIISARMVVRRLTPLECDRLQGYPDDWTDIGEWTDSRGKKRKTSDSNRYKADGNSIALPFWFWLLRRISAQYERPATLGSLFDGIGGFPLCWERCNGPGTALWASEIDEFAIAVTRRRFGE